MVGRGRFVGPRWLVAASAGLALLGACSTPMPRAPAAPPPDPAPAAATAHRRPSRPRRPAPPPTRSSAPPPTAPDATPPPLPPTPPVVSVPPVSPAIAARFPEPNVSFATPAFEAGRTAFTTNDELHAFLLGLTRSGAGAGRGSGVELLPIGVSQRGTTIEALAFTRPYVAPAVAATSGPAASIGRRPAVVVVAGQHGDEPAGTEALLVVAQQLAAGRFERVLEQLDVFLLPRANPDGAALGQRAAADGVDLNRDHLLLRTPEAAGPGRAGARRRAAGGARPARVPGRRRPVERPLRRGPALRRAAAVRDHRQHAAVRHQGGRGMVPRAARRQPRRRRLQQRLVSHRSRPTRPIAGSRWAAPRRSSAATPTA